jgi:SAM-dependent methyltransferase
MRSRMLIIAEIRADAMPYTGRGSMRDWKEAVYQSYVSSGHIRESGGSAAEHFEPRRAYLEALIREHFPSDRDSRVLDIGCGHGALLYFLHRASYRNARGVDGSKEQVELAKRLGVPCVELGRALSSLQDCEPASAEVICLFDVLEHLDRQEAFELLTEVRRVLSANGVCIGHAPNAEGIFGARIRYGDLTHEQAFTASSIRQMFGSLQFSAVQCFEDKPIIHGAKSLLRRVIWEVGTTPIRILNMAETGASGAILSQNLLFKARR